MRQAICSISTTLFALVSLTTGATSPAHGQSAPVTSQTQNVLNYYGGNSARATLRQMPRRSAIQPNASSQLARGAKPFQAASNGPTVSPYLNLFRDEDERSEAVPAYYSFVRPQFEQQTANFEQQREIHQLQRQMHSGSQVRTAPAAGVGAQARFMDTAQFYGGWR